ncbi:MAG: DsrE/DsrF/DrsH-like family protein [Magnetococcales bacterium]|nr:DsrE/DsrF/DrsH-like family protein [Magnetococcales bacterium]
MIQQPHHNADSANVSGPTSATAHHLPGDQHTALAALVDAAVQRQLHATLAPLHAAVTALEQRLPRNKVAIVVFSDDMDKVLAGFVIANGALAMDMEVSLYFTFWGLSAIREATHSDGKAFKQRLLNLFTPANSAAMGLSKLQMLGMGPAMMRSLMREKNIASLEELREMAREMGARFISCTMAMELMGIQREELIPGVELGGVATFLEEALHARTTLFL